MMCRSTIAVAVLAIVGALPIWNQDQGPQEKCDTDSRQRTKPLEARPVKKMKVARLVFLGDLMLSTSVQDQIAKSLAEHDYDDDNQGFEELLARVRDAWQAQGHFKVIVENGSSQTMEETSDRKSVSVTVNVDAGKQYRLEQIHVKDGPSGLRQPEASNEPFSEEQLRALFPIQPGHIFNTHQLQKGMEKLRQTYGMKGFIDFVVVPSFEIDEVSNRISVLLDIYQGKQFRIGNVQILGADPETAQALITSSGLKSGSVFDPSRLEHLEGFKDFKPENDVRRVIDGQRGTVDLIVDLRKCM
jgi:outer membrane protein assembly factor BamA